MQTHPIVTLPATSPRRFGGFTLIELVVAMLIGAILVAIAIPSYSNYVRKSRRVDAKSALLDIASLEERYFSTQQVYSSNLSDLGYGAAASVNVGSGTGDYTILAPTVTLANPPTATFAGSPATWTTTATAINDQMKDTSCRIFTITSGGLQTATDSSGNPATGCW